MVIAWNRNRRQTRTNTFMVQCLQDYCPMTRALKKHNMADRPFSCASSAMILMRWCDAWLWRLDSSWRFFRRFSRVVMIFCKKQKNTEMSKNNNNKRNTSTTTSHKRQKWKRGQHANESSQKQCHYNAVIGSKTIHWLHSKYYASSIVDNH